MTTPYAKLLVQVNGAASASGGIVVAAAATIQLLFESTVGWEKYQLELVGPPGYAGPAGWTSQNGVFVYTGVDTPPPSFALPAIAGWGKFMLALTVNDGKRFGAAEAAMVDKSTALSMLSTRGVEDVGYLEESQFDAFRGWLSPVQSALRKLDAAGGSLTTLYEVDFSTLTTSAAFTDGATVTIDGKAWTYQDNGNTPTQKQIVNGSGLVFGSTAFSQMCVWTSLLTLCPTLDFDRPFIVEARVARSGAMAGNGAIEVGLTDAAQNNASPGFGWNTTGAYLFKTGYTANGAAHHTAVRTGSGSTDVDIYSRPTFTTDDVYVLRFDNFAYAAHSALWSTTWPPASDRKHRGTRFGHLGDINNEPQTIANMGFVFGFFGGAASTSGTLKRLRIRQ